MSSSKNFILLSAVLAAGTLSSTLVGQGESSKVLIPKLQSLTITGEYRLRFEERYNYDLKEQVSDDNDFFTQRFRLNFDAKVTDNVSAYVQFQDVRSWGDESGTTDGSANNFDVHRAYMLWSDTPFGGTAKVGRQVLAFGDQRLVGGLEWLSQGRAFDGIRHTWKKEDRYTLDFFATQVREVMPSVTHDDQLFAGLYFTLDSVDNMEFDAYLLHLNDEETAGGLTENRSTLGVRWEQNFSKQFEAGIEAATQSGEVNNVDIDAQAFHGHLTWNFGGNVKPWARLEGNYATGDDPTTAGDNERFKNLFPTAHAHWGMMDFALWENMMHYMVQFGIKPKKNSKLAISWHAFESVEETDRFVGPAGKVAPSGAAAGTSNDIGSEIDVFYNVEFDTAPARTWVQLGYGIFLPGSGARTTMGDDDTAHFFYLMSGVVF